MAQLVWSVLCRKGVLDKYTNQMSLLDVIDELTIAPAGPIPPGAQDVFLAVQFHVVSLWMRSDLSMPESVRFRIVISGPDGRSFGPEGDINLQDFARARHFMRFEALPFHGAGLYRFSIERYLADTADWEKLASVPLEVKIVYPAPQSEPPSTEPGLAPSLRPTRAFDVG